MAQPSGMLVPASYGAGAVGPVAGVPPRASSATGTNLWVGNLPPGFTDAEVRALFGGFGTVLACRVMQRKQAHIAEEAALVNFSTPAEADMAIQALSGQVLPSSTKPLIVKHSAPKDTPGSGGAAG
eukprot:RCo007456